VRRALIKRTNINLDMELIAQAGAVLNTERTTDTVHEALREVIDRSRRGRLARRDFPELTLEALEAERHPRRG
jgi:Arc/MetJ family transcription regulator